MSNLNKIPAQLRDRIQWVVWKYTNRGGKPTKVPYQPSGNEARSNDSATWSDFDTCAAIADQYEGVGFMLSAADPFVGVDLDGCRDAETGEIEPWARDIIAKANTYTEVSPSQTGVKLFVRGTWPHGGKRMKFDLDGEICDKAPGIEVYSQLRYFATTGMRLSGVSVDVEERQEMLDWLYQQHFQPKSVASSHYEPCSQSEAEVVERARKYVARMEPAISGQGGHDATFAVACRLVLGFGLSEGDARVVLGEYNQRCQPAWSDRELQHKLSQAAKQSGPRNYLRDAKPESWDRVSIPAYEASTSENVPEPVSKWLKMDELVQKHIDNLRENGETPKVSLGIGKLDRVLGGGVRYGDLVVVGGLSSHMKSGWVQQIGHHVTRELKLPFAFLSLEMAPDAIAERTIQFASDCPKEHWHHSTMRIEEDAKRHFQDAAPYHVVECGVMLKDVVSEVKNLLASGTRLIAIDYAQLILTPGWDDQTTTLRKVSGALKQLAKQNDAIIFLLAQLRKTVEERKPLIPRQNDIEYGPKLGQDSDVCLLVVWPHRVDSSNPPHEYQIFVAKQRQGASNVAIKCRFDPPRLRITEDAPEYREPANQPQHCDKPGVIQFEDGFDEPPQGPYGDFD